MFLLLRVSNTFPKYNSAHTVTGPPLVKHNVRCTMLTHNRRNSECLKCVLGKRELDTIHLIFCLECGLFPTQHTPPAHRESSFVFAPFSVIASFCDWESIGLPLLTSQMKLNLLVMFSSHLAIKQQRWMPPSCECPRPAGNAVRGPVMVHKALTGRGITFPSATLHSVIS